MPEPFAVAEHPHPLAVLGDVDEIEEHAKRAGDELGLVLRKSFDAGGEHSFRVVIAGPAVVGEGADLLDESEGLGAGEPSEHVAEEVVEEANVTAEQVVGGHERVSRGQRGERAGLAGSIEAANPAPSHAQRKSAAAARPAFRGWPGNGQPVPAKPANMSPVSDSGGPFAFDFAMPRYERCSVSGSRLAVLRERTRFLPH